MSVPVHPPPFFAPQFATTNNGMEFWPQTPIDNERFESSSHGEYPPFKKPRISEVFPSNHFLNPPPNQLIHPLNPPPCKGISRIFFKTRLCVKFKIGTCPYGDNCNFAHGIEDIRKPPPNWQEIVASHANDEERMAGNWDEDQRLINKLKLCKKFYNGEECPYGERCNFFHEEPGKFREISVISIGTMGSPGGTRSGSDPPEGNEFIHSNAETHRFIPKPVFWKTRICIKWETTGHCPFGEKCHFAHGQTELQRYAGHTEAETGNTVMAPIKSLPNPIKEVSPSNTGPGASFKQQGQIKKNLLKWKGPEKISRIYADWIDDLPLLQSSPR